MGEIYDTSKENHQKLFDLVESTKARGDPVKPLLYAALRHHNDKVMVTYAPSKGFGLHSRQRLSAGTVVARSYMTVCKASERHTAYRHEIVDFPRLAGELKRVHRHVHRSAAPYWGSLVNEPSNGAPPTLRMVTLLKGTRLHPRLGGTLTVDLVAVSTIPPNTELTWIYGTSYDHRIGYSLPHNGKYSCTHAFRRYVTTCEQHADCHAFCTKCAVCQSCLRNEPPRDLKRAAHAERVPRPATGGGGVLTRSQTRLVAMPRRAAKTGER